MSKQGLIDNGADVYIYQQRATTQSVAVGIDNTDDKFKIATRSSIGIDPSSTYQFSIDGSANGDMEFVPLGSGTVDVTQLTVRPDTAVDSTITFQTTTPQSFIIGIDRGADTLQLAADTSLTALNDIFLMYSQGFRTMRQHACMNAYVSANVPNVLGGAAPAGGQLDMPADTVVFDQNGNYANPFFTAPVTGIYFFAGVGTVYNLSAASTVYVLNFNDAGIATGGHTFSIRPIAARNGVTGELTLSGGGMFFRRTAGQTFTFRFVVGYGSMTVGIGGDAAMFKSGMTGGLFV